MSLEMAHKVILPPKKNYIPQFLKQRDINSYFLGYYKVRGCSQSNNIAKEEYLQLINGQRTFLELEVSFTEAR
jgi:hypothetical protein